MWVCIQTTLDVYTIKQQRQAPHTPECLQHVSNHLRTLGFQFFIFGLSVQFVWCRMHVQMQTTSLCVIHTFLTCGWCSTCKQFPACVSAYSSVYSHICIFMQHHLSSLCMHYGRTVVSFSLVIQSQTFHQVAGGHLGMCLGLAPGPGWGPPKRP